MACSAIFLRAWNKAIHHSNNQKQLYLSCFSLFEWCMASTYALRKAADHAIESLVLYKAYLTQPVTRESFIDYLHWESLKSYAIDFSDTLVLCRISQNGIRIPQTPTPS